MVAGVTLILVVLWLAGDFLPEPLRLDELPRGSVVALVAGLGAAFILYVVEKEASLRRLTTALIEERVRSGGLRARLGETTSIAEVAKALNSSLELEDVFRLILASALQLLDGQEGSIMLLDPTGNHLEVVSYRGPRGPAVMSRKVKLGEGVAGRVAADRTALLLQGDEVEGRSENSPPPGSIHSSLCVPLIRHGELIGVLSINETHRRRSYTEGDLAALQVFAEHAAIAIGNATMFEQEREHVQRLEELDRLKSDFVASVSHELKTPLTAIIGAAKTVSRGAGMDPDERAIFLEMIQRQGSRLLRLVEDVLTAARIESGGPRRRREKVDLRSVGELVVTDLSHTRQGEGRTITLETVPERPEAWGDLTSIQQILSNLVENACKYSSPGEPVEIRIVESPIETVIEVADRGPGIDPKHLQTIFERFRQADSSATRHVGGFGLGLYIVKNLVEEHRGAVEVESSAGKGTVFRVRLPRGPSERDTAPALGEEIRAQ